MTDKLFHIIEDGFVILSSRGVYRQSKLYERDGRLFAGYGSGFIGLSANGTTVPTVRWCDIIAPSGHSYEADNLGRMCLTNK